MEYIKLKNKERIDYITMLPTAITKCQIGQDWYKHEFVIDFTPDEYYPDYMQVEKFIMDEIDGKELNIEQAVDILYKFLKETYHPSELKINDHIRGNKVHFDVIVCKGE